MVKKHIVPAILVKKKSDLVKKLRGAAPYCQRVQIDIIDGKFANNKTIGPKSIKGVRTKLKKEIQLMVKDMDKYVDAFIKQKPWMIIFHIESCKNKKHVDELIKKIKKAKIKAGIGLSPKTPASKVKPFLKKIDLVLVMTVKPGWGGQKFIKKMLPKIRQLRKWDKKIDIEVDGGIKPGTACLAAKAGANVFVAGGAIYKAKSIKSGVQQLKNDVRCMT
ncbi:ribulose-phosphate 3-epimerase [Candidatus Woesearchaeota archaeon]|nr:ribulose-phosphate 3-epimerase [Candidatus Woesearchaeota archaeon]MBW3005802.1 ribulose-phosphate 3-epimerase [Candidatus Woesearchaeota archaeon]